MTQSDAEAVHWYRKAADQGDAEAQFYLGVCYDNGQGVPKDETEAVKWYRRPPSRGMQPRNLIWVLAMRRARRAKE